MELLKIVRRSFFSALIIVVTGTVSAQTSKVDSVYSGDFVPVQYERDYLEIRGSAYLHEQLAIGEIRYRRGETKSCYMRYNIFEDVIEYLEEGKLLTINNPQDTKSVIIGSTKFVFTAFEGESSMLRGYLIEASSGKVTLYARPVIDFFEEEEGVSGYHRKKPDEFRLKPTRWLVKQGNAISEISTSKSGLSEVFGFEFKEVDEFRKKEKLKMRKDSDVIKMFNYYNSL